MSAASDSTKLIRALGIGIAVFAAICALGWLYFAEPWYSNQVIGRMQGGEYQAPWRDETSRISDLFPDGMSHTAAVRLLEGDGFSCDWGGGDKTKPRQISCSKKVSNWVCRTTYTVRLTPDDHDAVRDRSAQSYAACL